MLPSRWMIALLLCGSVFGSANAVGDLIRLQNGGEARGVIVSTDKKSGTTTLQTQSGSLITFPDNQIDFISRRSEKVEEYVTRSRQLEPSVESHLELAEWCRINGLPDQREEELERVLDLDPDHPDVRKTLGYVRHLGRWMTKDEMMAERGYFRHKGRWVTQQELDLLEKNAAQKSAELAWNSKIRTWTGWLTGSSPDRQQTALNELQSIRDPDAVAAVTKFMASHQVPEVRLLSVKTLAQIPGLRPLPPLVERYLTDPHEAVRQSSLQVILKSHSAPAVPLLIAALKHKANPVICRAATALAEIGNEEAVPALIDALITTHSYQRQVATPVVNRGIQFSFGGTVAPGMSPGILPPDVEIASRTGQLPYGVNVSQSPSPPMVMRPVTIVEEVKNPDVLTALEKLTGQDFGFNERNWHLWWAANKG
ncbi:MAG TPA: HEAT repeat domain-containing protein [Planctomicrobium sp.]|nr:HEAT repeat domain-containing protein [Planctomicrobium sp.]